jgi:hypothetical protein
MADELHSAQGQRATCTVPACCQPPGLCFNDTVLTVAGARCICRNTGFTARICICAAVRDRGSPFRGQGSLKALVQKSEDHLKDADGSGVGAGVAAQAVMREATARTVQGNLDDDGAYNPGWWSGESKEGADVPPARQRSRSSA